MDIPLLIHIIAAAIALLAGTTAICASKGGALHRRAGLWFVWGMVIMAVPAAGLSLSIGKPFDFMSSLLSVYLVLSGWLTFTTSNGQTRLMLMGLGGLCFAGYLGVELYAILTGVRATDAPTGAGYIFATVLACALWGDARQQHQGSSKRRQVIRHLWRMNFGLLIATASFFGARPHLFPDWMQTSGLLLGLTVAPLLVMGYWRFRLCKGRTPQLQP